MKVESLVIVDQHATVNLYLSLVLPARHAPEVVWKGNILKNPQQFPLEEIFVRFNRKIGRFFWAVNVCAVTGAKS